MTKYPTTQEARSTNDEGQKKPYDVEERTALFGEAVVAGSERVASDLCEDLPRVTSVCFGFLVSDFLRAWLFRHSDFWAHPVF